MVVTVAGLDVELPEPCLLLLPHALAKSALATTTITTGAARIPRTGAEPTTA